MAASDITLAYCSESSRIDVLWHFKQAEPRSQGNKHVGRCKAVDLSKDQRRSYNCYFKLFILVTSKNLQQEKSRKNMKIR